VAKQTLRARISDWLDRVDSKIDKPTRERGTFTSGSETIINDGDAEAGRAATRKRSFGRRGF